MSQIRLKARELVEFMVREYSLASDAKVLYWRVVMEEFAISKAMLPPDWTTKAQKAGNRELKKYFPLMKEILREEYRILILKLNAQVQSRIQHNHPPIRDDKSRTDAWYRECLPSSCNPTHCLASFPSGAMPDHPLLISQLGARVTTASNTLVRSVNGVDEARRRLLLSDVATDLLLKNVQPAAERIKQVTAQPMLPFVS